MAHIMRFRCREQQFRQRFSVRYGTVLHSSNWGCQVWKKAIYLSLISLKSVSSMKLHRDPDLTQKAVRHLAHRLRKAFAIGDTIFIGPDEVDETHMGGRGATMPKAKRERMTSRIAVGKIAIVEVKDRATKQVRSTVVESTDKAIIHVFVTEHAAPDATIYSNDAFVYEPHPNPRNSVNHSGIEHVRSDVHTNGIESFWSMFKRTLKGTFRKLSPKHLNHSVRQFAAKHNLQDRATLDIMGSGLLGMDGKRPRYVDLIRDNGVDFGARC